MGYLPWPGGVPTLSGGYIAWQAVPTLARQVPTLAGEVPTLAGGTYLCWGLYLPCPGGTYLGGYPPGVDRQTPVKTVPSRRTTYAGAKYVYKCEPMVINI